MRRRILGLGAIASMLALALSPPALAAERSVGETKPATTYIEVVTVDPATGLPVFGGGGGSGGPTSIADGSDIALGARGDAAWAGSGNGTAIAILKSIRNLMAAPLTVNGTVSVTGTFWQATQPVSTADGSNLALGARADAAWSGTGSGSAIAVLKSIRGQLAGTLSVSASSLPLPAGAATSALQGAANTSLAAIDGDLGAAADPEWPGSGNGTVISLLKTIAGTASSTEPAETQLTPSSAYFNPAVGATKYLVITGPAVLTDYFVENPDESAKAYLQIFNAASTGAVTLGTTAPTWSIGLDPGEKANLSGLALSFPLGLVIAGTSTVTGSTAAASSLVVNLGYRGN